MGPAGQLAYFPTNWMRNFKLTHCPDFGEGKPRVVAQREAVIRANRPFTFIIDEDGGRRGRATGDARASRTSAPSKANSAKISHQAHRPRRTRFPKRAMATLAFDAIPTAGFCVARGQGFLLADAESIRVRPSLPRPCCARCDQLRCKEKKVGFITDDYPMRRCA